MWQLRRERERKRARVSERASSPLTHEMRARRAACCTCVRACRARVLSHGGEQHATVSRPGVANHHRHYSTLPLRRRYRLSRRAARATSLARGERVSCLYSAVCVRARVYVHARMYMHVCTVLYMRSDTIRHRRCNPLGGLTCLGEILGIERDNLPSLAASIAAY